MAQLAQGLGFDLADPLARDVELLADLLERVRLAVDQTKAHAQHLLLPRRQRGQDFLELLAQQGIGGLLRRLRRLVVLDEVAEMAVFLLADGRFERDGLLRNLQDLFDLALLDVQLVGACEVRSARLMVSTMCTGMRIVRAWSAMARVIDWRIHQVA